MYFSHFSGLNRIQVFDFPQLFIMKTFKYIERGINYICHLDFKIHVLPYFSEKLENNLKDNILPLWMHFIKNKDRLFYNHNTITYLKKWIVIS